MSLATRLSVFFVMTIAVVLACFSCMLYAFQHWTVQRETDARLVAALTALVATIEIEADGVEWNPREHRFAASVDDSIHWRVTLDSGEVIDESPHFPAIDVSSARPTEGLASVDAWRVLSDRVSVEDAPPGELLPDNDLETDLNDGPEYPALTVTAALSTSETASRLRRLAWALTFISIGTWGVIAAFSRYLVSRALRPLTKMARSAAGLDALSGSRLPVEETKDEVAELGHAINGLIDKLAAEFEREQRFSTEASHQLRTPVTALLGQLDVALRRDRTNEEYRETLGMAHFQAERLRRIVESLLELARADTDEPLSIGHDPVSLGQWLSNYVQSWSGYAEADRIRVEVPDTGNGTVEVDVRLLGQLLDILVDNAFKHGGSDSPILLRLSESGRAIEVIDHGHGIPDAELGDVFRPFYRGSASVAAGVPGLGLGLAIGQRIAVRLGATLSYSRTPEGYSLFTVSLDGR